MAVTPWIGNASAAGATVKAYVDPDQATLNLQYSVASDLSGAVTVAGIKGGDNVFRFELVGLAASTRYYYGFDGGATVGNFRTFPAGAAHFTVALGGDTTTTNSPVFDRILDRDPQLFMHLGDLHYRDINSTDPVPYRTAYRDMLASAPFAAVVRSVPSAYVWDDHDFTGNDSNGTAVGKATAQQVYEEHVPHWDFQSTTGQIYHTFVLGRVRFVQIDSRSGRSPLTDPDGPAKTLLGAEQKRWLKETLLAATEPLIVLNIMTWPGDFGSPGFSDGWSTYATERRELYDFIEAHELVDRLLLIGADHHALIVDDGAQLNFASDPSGPGPAYLGFAPLNAFFTDFGVLAQTYQVSNRQYGTLDIEDDGVSVRLRARGWAVAADGSESEVFTFSRVYPPPGSSIEAWVTTPAGAYIAHLDRSEESPFRRFAFSLIRNQPGSASLEYHLDVLDDNPTLFDLGNLVWMKYRSVTRVYIIEDETTVLDQNEHETDYRKVSGRGVLQLLGDRLVFPTAFASGTNLDPKTWGEDNQWRRFTNRATGELLWDLISESNPRFAAQLTRGTVQTTGADGVTIDYRFENVLDDVVKPLTDAYGDVEMAGLRFNYYNAQGTDRSSIVIFEEGADLLRLTHQQSDRGRVSYVVGEGVGEGVFAKLAIASRADARRIEGFAALKEASNVPLLEVLTDAALAEHPRTETTSFDVDETRYKAFTDYNLGDTVRALSPSRNVDEVQRIDAIYVAEDSDQVRVSLDLAGLRDDELLRLDEEGRKTRSQLGVRNRQPQGQLVPFPFNAADVFDSTDTMDVFLFVPGRIYVMVEAKAQLHFREFFAPATAATSGGGATSGSGGSSTPTSGASSAASSASGGSSAPTSGASSATTTTDNNAVNHFHTIASSSGGAGAFTARKMQGNANSTTGDFNLETATAGYIATNDTATVHNHSMPHTHTVTIGAHDHTIAHTHTVTIAAHDHTTPAHTHGLTFGVHKEAYPASHSAELRVYERVGAVWTLRSTLTGLTEDIEEVDLTATIVGPGSWKLSIKSAAAQPQGGRLGCDVAGYVLGAIKSS